jgi:hypothetical protein
VTRVRDFVTAHVSRNDQDQRVTRFIPRTLVTKLIESSNTLQIALVTKSLSDIALGIMPGSFQPMGISREEVEANGHPA